MSSIRPCTKLPIYVLLLMRLRTFAMVMERVASSPRYSLWTAQILRHKIILSNIFEHALKADYFCSFIF